MYRSTSLNLASLALTAAALMAAPAAMAAPVTGSLAVTATVLSTCVVVSTPVVFGAYSLGAVDASGLITVTCTPDISSYHVALGTGIGAGATTVARKMTSLASSDTLTYGLFSNSARTQNWGELSNVDSVLSAAATSSLGAVKTFAVYGRIAADQAAATGAYLDTVQITINFDPNN